MPNIARATDKIIAILFFIEIRSFGIRVRSGQRSDLPDTTEVLHP
jgi:hypothetical protein